MNKANGPSNRHSPFSAPACEFDSVVLLIDVAIVLAALATAEAMASELGDKGKVEDSIAVAPIPGIGIDSGKPTWL